MFVVVAAVFPRRFEEAGSSYDLLRWSEDEGEKGRGGD
jgi:hypothetical protein